MPHFNPRSPCGERPFAPMFRAAMYYFNPRSPCGERRPKTELSPIWTLFQSTLPVRGATGSRAWHWPPDNDFNPRSPCGERQMALSYKGMSQAISIHAPRAGSDTYYFFVPNRLVWISIHAPRAGSDGKSAGHHTGPPQFQSTLPVRGATAKMPKTEPFILSNFHNFKKYTDRTRTKVIIKMELWINLSPFSGANRTGNLWSLLLRTLKGS